MLHSATTESGQAFTTTEVIVNQTETIVEKSIYTEITEEIYELPSITPLTNTNIQLKDGSNLHVEVKVDPFNDSSMDVKWYHNEEQLQTGHRVTTIHSFGYAVLEIIDMGPEDCGTYQCVAKNQKGFSQQTFNISMIPEDTLAKPQFLHPFQSNIDVNEGDSIQVTSGLVPSDDNQMQVEWFHNGEPLRQSSRIKTTSDFGYVILEISRAEPFDSGEYTAVATNGSGSDTNTFRLNCSPTQNILHKSIHTESLAPIQRLEQAKTYEPRREPEGDQMAPRFFHKLIDRIELAEGQSVHIETQLTPINDPTMQVEFYRDGQPLIASERFRSINEFGFVILDITTCYAEDSGVYEIVARNDYGADSLQTTIICKGKLIFLLKRRV